MNLSKTPQDLTALVNRNKKEEESVCIHFNYCLVKKSGRDCSNPAYKDCQAKGSYDEFGEAWNQMGVGS